MTHEEKAKRVSTFAFYKLHENGISVEDREMWQEIQEVADSNKELRTRVAELEAEAKMGNIPYKEAVELKKRVAELEQRMIDQANMICKKSNEADMERRTAEMHCADAVKLSKRVEELEKENKELRTRVAELEKERDGLLDRFRVEKDRIWDLKEKELAKLQIRLSTLLKASEGMEKALEDIKYHADNPFASKNGEANRKWLAYCQDVAFKALADFRALKETK